MNKKTRKKTLNMYIERLEALTKAGIILQFGEEADIDVVTKDLREGLDDDPQALDMVLDAFLGSLLQWLVMNKCRVACYGEHTPHTHCVYTWSSEDPNPRFGPHVKQFVGPTLHSAALKAFDFTGFKFG